MIRDTNKSTGEVVHEPPQGARLTLRSFIKTDDDGNAWKYASRGYYLDAETGLYYVGNRYYDPVVGRFISPDTTEVLTAVPMALRDKNLYAYCNGNPVMYKDVTGAVAETIFDVVSLGISVMEVVTDPCNAWNWLNLVADTADLIPFITGLGESVRLLKTPKSINYSNVMTSGTPNKIGKMGESFVGINQKEKK